MCMCVYFIVYELKDIVLQLEIKSATGRLKDTIEKISQKEQKTTKKNTKLEERIEKCKKKSNTFH